MSSLCRGHANLLCIIPILVHVLLKRAQDSCFCERVLSPHLSLFLLGIIRRDEKTSGPVSTWLEPSGHYPLLMCRMQWTWECNQKLQNMTKLIIEFGHTLSTLFQPCFLILCNMNRPRISKSLSPASLLINNSVFKPFLSSHILL